MPKVRGSPSVSTTITIPGDVYDALLRYQKHYGFRTFSGAVRNLLDNYDTDTFERRTPGSQQFNCRIATATHENLLRFARKNGHPLNRVILAALRALAPPPARRVVPPRPAEAEDGAERATAKPAARAKETKAARAVKGAKTAKAVSVASSEARTAAPVASVSAARKAVPPRPEAPARRASR